MGEYADMMIDGESCIECGTWLIEAVGYARKCKYCRKQETKRIKNEQRLGSKQSKQSKNTSGKVKERDSGSIASTSNTPETL